MINSICHHCYLVQVLPHSHALTYTTSETVYHIGHSVSLSLSLQLTFDLSLIIGPVVSVLLLYVRRTIMMMSTTTAPKLYVLKEQHNRQRAANLNRIPN